MTSEILRYSTCNAFVDNDVFCLRRDAKLSGIDIAASGWLCNTDNVRVAHAACGALAISEVCAKLQNAEPWLIACHSAWQIDNAVNRRYKLWKSLQRRGIRLPKGKTLNEQLLATPKGIKWFSAAQFAASDIPVSLAIIQEEPASLVAVVPNQSDALINSIIRATWKNVDIGPSSDVLSAIIGGHGFLMWPLGAFDDPEAGVAVFGDPTDLHLLIE